MTVSSGAAAEYHGAVLHPRFASAAAALAFVAVACSDDTAPQTGNGPPFEGVSYVVPDKDGNLVVAWKPAAEATDYRVYVSKIQGRALKTAPAIRSNGTAVTLKPEAPGVRYYVVVRAANVQNAEDNNTVEKSAIASPDTEAPTFAGIKTAAADGNAGVKLTWDPATDNFTPPEAIVYDVFASRVATDLVRVATTLPGDTSISFSQFGNPGERLNFEVAARDIAGNVSEKKDPTEVGLGPDATPPTFAGCDAVTPQGGRGAVVTWTAGTDNATSSAELTYEVYVSKTTGAQDLNTPAAKTAAGATTATLTNLDPGSSYFVLCKARDKANNLDANKNEKSLQTSSDVTPPKFDGITNATFDGKVRTVTLEWTAATDDQTASTGIVYDVFESKATNAFDYTSPPKVTTAPGATSVVLANLASRSTLYWNVRARDAAGNRDTNPAEKSGTTEVSFSEDVQHVFDRNCAVVGCHVTGPAPFGLNLAPGFAFAQTVNQPAREKAGLMKIKPGDAENSWLYQKITDPKGIGALMPAPQTGNTLTDIDKGIIRDWINNGAQNN